VLNAHTPNYLTPSGSRNVLENELSDIGFRVGSYDVRRPLIIDPVFTFSTYLDGTGLDEVAAVTTDSSGNIYLTGTTGPTNFPTQGSEQSHLGCTPSGSSNCQNAFITKLDPTGKRLMYSTYLGGSALDFGAAIAVDTNGNAILGGVSTSMDFPHAGSVPSVSCQTNNCCYFVASLKPDGSELFGSDRWQVTRVGFRSLPQSLVWSPHHKLPRRAVQPPCIQTRQALVTHCDSNNARVRSNEHRRGVEPAREVECDFVMVYG
jgi:hypothetical protein